MTTVNINIERINHLLRLYRITDDDLLLFINKDLKKPYKKEDIFRKEIKLNLLKKIDKIFNKGLSYYIDPSPINETKEESIFFRKDKFNAELNWSAKKIVNQFEEEKITFSALSKLSNIKHDRILSDFTIKNDPKEVAKEIRKKLYPDSNCEKRKFLKSLIEKFAEYNILVFEFVESGNKKEPANINGFYLSPNTIVLKRNQKSISREIFTLIHELGHYLLNEEEIDNINDDNPDYNSLNKIERWCDNFAYYFLIGEYDRIINDLDIANRNNNYHRDILFEIAQQTHLSVFALYKRLFINAKISHNDYKQICSKLSSDIEKKEQEKQREYKLKKQRALEEGKKIIIPSIKPFISPLYINTIQSAFYEGIINEMEFCKRLNIKPNQIDKYLE